MMFSIFHLVIFLRARGISVGPVENPVGMSQARGWILLTNAEGGKRNPIYRDRRSRSYMMAVLNMIMIIQDTYLFCG